ncbi:MAG: hypothetical protein NXI03_11030 [Alphaproteobacteria bacterium]|nr:hypothetical protein [Maricaulis alexandrii]MCR9268093.1 hypothetical protein [Alphaproteobacteria bacterium]
MSTKDKSIEIDKTDARQANKLKSVRFVLGISLAAAIVTLGLIYVVFAAN